MNYQITEPTKELIEKMLTHSAMIIATIPDRFLEGDLKTDVAVVLHGLQECSRRLENAVTIPFIDIESDTQTSK